MSCVATYGRQRQSQTNWCWAAVAASVKEHYSPGAAITQCSVASTAFSPTDCCASPSSCNLSYNLQSALLSLGHMSGVPASTAPPFTKCDNEVETLDQPIGVRIQWAGCTRGHFIAITGVSNKHLQRLVVEDPDYGQVIIEHLTMKSSYQSNPRSTPIGSWDRTYFTKR